MGKKNNVLNHYFRDTNRFADLFNGVFFGGRRIIKAQELEAVSESYEEATGRESENEGLRQQRFRDIRMTLKTGEVFRLLALENQDKVNYAMPFRCMQYDAMEYSRQLDELRKKNGRAGKYGSTAERVGRIKKSDRLTPIYTLCVYYGEEPWDGPRSLRDMMNFGDDSDGMSKYFADYPMRLFCLNEKDDFDEFHSEIRKVFHLLKFRGDKKQMEQELETNAEYRRVDIDTLEVMAVMLDAPQIWKNREDYMVDEEESEEYDMCKAIREMTEDAKNMGRTEGRTEGEQRFARLIQKLLELGKNELIEKVAEDAEMRRQMMEEYGLI